MEKKVEKYDVVIIGGGAAGLTAALYCGRARLNTLVIEKALIGGLATYTNEIENYPGFPDGTTGINLMNLFHQQAKKFNVKFKLTDVKSVDFTSETKVVETFRNRFEADVVIVASGGKPRLTYAEGEADFLYDKGISFCATCDAAANTDKDIIVIGSGDCAIEEGMFLTKFAKKVYVSVMHSEGIMDCNEIAKAEALANPKMEFIWDTVVEEFKGNDKLETVVLKNLRTNELVPIKVDTCFIFIGYEPNTDIFVNKLAMNKNGYILTNEKMETGINGVFAAGDVREKFLKQVATAVGDGAIAGYAAEKYIAESHMFNTQILNDGKPSVVYIYNAIDKKSREFLIKVEELEKEHIDICFSKVDTYKSDGIAKRLNVSNGPALLYIENNKVLKKIDPFIEMNLETIFTR